MGSNILKQINLLYVEDDEAVRKALSRGIRKRVKNLYLAQDGQDGYEKYLEYKPDIIITDINMPILNGLQMATKIRDIDEDIPIIITTAHNETDIFLKSIELKISGFLLKPIDTKKLFDSIETNTKAIILQRQNEEQKAILQKIINTKKSTTIVTNFKEINFVNNAFLDFFDVENIGQFVKENRCIVDMFSEHDDFIHKNLLDSNIKLSDNIKFGKLFYELVKNTDETKRVVLMINKFFEPKSFYIDILIIDEKNGFYLLELTDITKMTIEKVVTEHKAYVDGLTGVYNRNKFEEIFTIEVDRAKRYKNPLSIAMLDIDHFKKFNDTYGHLIGDEVLIMLAQNVNSNVRKTDLFARWGGEEFVVIFRETDIDNAVKISNMLREKIYDIEHKTAGKITASFGVTKYKDGDTLEAIFKRCDDALYKAKENGRNRVEFIE